MPESERAKAIRAVLDDRAWNAAVELARARARLVDEVTEANQETGRPWRQCLREATADVPPTTFVHWLQWARRWSQGPLWERFVFHSFPPPPRERTPEAVVVSAQTLRRANPEISAEDAQRALREQFGDVPGLSPTMLKRFWERAGLARPRGGGAREQVEHHAGGAGLVLLHVADEELGATAVLARSAKAAGKRAADEQDVVESREEVAGARDAKGQFTAEYNAQWRQDVEPGAADGRWASDETKRTQRELASLSVLEMKSETVAASMLQMGLTSLLVHGRGFDGLSGPVGNWLGVLGTTAYMPATLDKRLAQFGLLGVEGALWQSYAQLWQPISVRWSQQNGVSWLQCALYVDATLDPYWTERFALAGKISRTGRIGPCLTRVMVTAGPGVPLLVEEYAGTVSLKTNLLPLLDRLEAVIGPGELRRLIIFDAEMATALVLDALAAHPQREFVTLLKGPLMRAVTVTSCGDWMPFRERDQLREVQVVIPQRLGLEEDRTIRGVQMHRPSVRNPYSVVFVTGADADGLKTTEVVEAYLSRWPHQEQLFRNGRNGGGLNRSHGYGGEFITHVALPTDLEKAKRRVARTEEKLSKVQEQRQAAEDTAGAQPKDAATRATLTVAKRTERTVTADLRRARAEHDKLENTPRLIYKRDVGRDSVMTCLKLTIVMLIEHVLRDYFGGLRMEWRTFIDNFVSLPVTIRTTRSRVRYQFHANLRALARMRQLQAACEVLNGKKLRRGKARLEFEVVDLPPP
jgi:hypothetical protein